MDAFDALASPDLRSLDPRGGVLVVTTYWRPRSADHDPEQPGEKLFILSYLPTGAKELCPCGSGKRFGIVLNENGRQLSSQCKSLSICLSEMVEESPIEGERGLS
jgi:hypothetical protein